MGDSVNSVRASYDEVYNGLGMISVCVYGNLLLYCAIIFIECYLLFSCYIFNIFVLLYVLFCTFYLLFF